MSMNRGEANGKANILVLESASQAKNIPGFQLNATKFQSGPGLLHWFDIIGDIIGVSTTS